MRPWGHGFALALCAPALAGCIAIGDADDPIPHLTVPARSDARERTLIVVLPGFANHERDLRKRGIAESIQEGWPEADVMLTGATFDYYRTGRLVPRLHEEIIQPARARGYGRIWLAGGSMGGMGVLLYETQHPNVVDGLVLFAPFLGDDDLLDEIRAAGGPRHWSPGKLGAQMDGDNYQRHVWRTVKGWTESPQRAQSVWLVCGADDHLLAAARLLAPVLPESNYHELPGGHTWEMWRRSARQIFAQIRVAAERPPPVQIGM